MRDQSASAIASRPSLVHEGLHDLFSQVAGRIRASVAIERDGRRVTYGELEAASNRLAQALLGGGLGRGAHVAIVAEDPASVITAILGVLKAGGVFIPLDPRFP